MLPTTTTVLSHYASHTVPRGGRYLLLLQYAVPGFTGLSATANQSSVCIIICIWQQENGKHNINNCKIYA